MYAIIREGDGKFYTSGICMADSILIDKSKTFAKEVGNHFVAFSKGDGKI